MKISHVVASTFLILFCIFHGVNAFLNPRLVSFSCNTKPDIRCVRKLRSCHHHSKSNTRPCITVRMSTDESPDLGSRLLACFPYILPLLDGIDSGKNIYEAVPPVRDFIFSILGSSVALWNGIPFVGFGVFIAFSIAARNPELPAIVRFSIQQAIITDIALILFSLLSQFSKFLSPAASDILMNMEFYFLISVVAYCIVRNLQGKFPNQVPIIDQQLSQLAEVQNQGSAWHDNASRSISYNECPHISMSLKSLRLYEDTTASIDVKNYRLEITPTQ